MLQACFAIDSDETMVEARIRENLNRIHERIASAAQRSGRRASDVQLVAVTKYVGVDEVRALAAAGCRDIGESRPQELWRKAEALSSESIRWHLVGHLQRNKVRNTLPHVVLIHSADSERLLKSIDREAQRLGSKTRVLLEVNVSGDTAKHGFAPDEVPSLLPQLADLKSVEVCGIMAMAGLDSGPEGARREFVQLRALRDQLRKNCPSQVSLDELSMGMSGDFEIAIEEGATIVRVGSALFEGME